jgi:Ca2+-binding EF-hand superfamily protein
MKKNELIHKLNRTENISDIAVTRNIIMKKFAIQWSTLQKAFRDLNTEKDGLIKDYELKYVLEHWGIKLNKEQF